MEQRCGDTAERFGNVAEREKGRMGTEDLKVSVDRRLLMLKEEGDIVEVFMMPTLKNEVCTRIARRLLRLTADYLTPSIHLSGANQVQLSHYRQARPGPLALIRVDPRDP